MINRDYIQKATTVGEAFDALDAEFEKTKKRLAKEAYDQWSRMSYTDGSSMNGFIESFNGKLQT